MKYRQRVRRRVEVRVMQDRCPMSLALARMRNAEMEEGESEHITVDKTLGQR